MASTLYQSNRRNGFPATRRILGISLAMLRAGVQGIRAQTTVGSGSYATAGAFAIPTAQPWVTPNFAQPIKSAQWWVTLITKRFPSSHAADLTIGIKGLNAEAARAASYSHGSVTAR